MGAGPLFLAYEKRDNQHLQCGQACINLPDPRSKVPKYHHLNGFESTTQIPHYPPDFPHNPDATRCLHLTIHPRSLGSNRRYAAVHCEILLRILILRGLGWSLKGEVDIYLHFQTCKTTETPPKQVMPSCAACAGGRRA